MAAATRMPGKRLGGKEVGGGCSSLDSPTTAVWGSKAALQASLLYLLNEELELKLFLYSTPTICKSVVVLFLLLFSQGQLLSSHIFSVFMPQTMPGSSNYSIS